MLIRLAFRNLMRNPRRTTAVLMTVMIGSGSIFIFHGFNAGIMNQYRENTVHSRYGHGQINTKGYREKVFEKPWEHWVSDWTKLKTRLLSLQGVTHVFPRLEFFSLLTNGKVNVSGRGQGVDGESEALFFTTLNVEEGVILSNQPDGILLGRGLAKSLDVKQGDRVTVLSNTINGSMNGADFTVTGIFHTGSKDFDDVVFRIQLPEAQKLLDTALIESIAVGLKSVEDWGRVETTINSEFTKLEATPFAVLDKVYYQHSVDWLDSQFGVIQIIIIAIVILGIFNTVSTGILERKQEIGNLRANGDSAMEIIRMFICEGVAIGLIGAALGLIIALLINSTILRSGILMPPAPGITRQFHVLIELQPVMAIKAFMMGALTAAIATLLAAIRVARLPIGDALRSV
ncbi:MAG: FtsX-like permease family protein [Bdellovibrionota bacterium]